MDRDIVERKLDSLRRCLQRVRDRTPASVQALQGDVDAQDVLVLNLSRAVQICVDLALHVLSGLDQPPPDSMGEAFDRLHQAGVLDAEIATRMKRSVGFRNIAVHAYDAIDWNIVHAIATRHLGDFEAFAQAMQSLLPMQEANARRLY